MSGYSNYPTYKPAQAEWMEAVPAHWEVLPCRAIVSERDERNETGKCQNYLSLMANVGVIPYEQKGDVGNKKPEDLSKCKLVNKGDLVINSMNYAIGSYGMSQYDGVCSPVYVVLQPSESKVLRRFALRIFENRSFQRYTSSFGQGILDHRRAIGWDDIKVLRIPVPSIDEQSAILRVLDSEAARIDSLVEKKARFIELLKEKRQAVITQAVTKGLDQNVSTKDSGIEWLGHVPEHWRVCALRWTATVQTGVALGKEAHRENSIALPYLRVANVQDGFLDLSEVKEIALAKEEVERFLLRPGDVLMNEGGDNDKLGRGAVWRGEISPCAHQNHVFAVRPSALLLSEWLALFTRSDAAKFYLWQSSKQSTNLASISSNNLKALSVPTPPMSEQRHILDALSKQLERMDHVSSLVDKSIALLRERRSALITAAVTGQIDVHDKVVS